MKSLLKEQNEQVYSEAHAKELLAIQKNYNKKLEALNTELATQKSNLMIKYMKIAQQQTATKFAQEKVKATLNTNTTGTVDTAGNPVTGTGGTPTVESYSDILRIKKLTEKEDDEIRFTHLHNNKDTRNWYQKPESQLGYEEPEPVRLKKRTFKITQKIWDIERDIEDLNQEIKNIREPLETPKFSGVQGEIEQFFAEIGFEASDILNSGISDQEKIKSLKDLGIKNPKEMIETYYYYYPEFDSSLDNKRKKAESEISKINLKIKKLQAQLDKIEEMYESLNEENFNTTSVDSYELQNLKDYLDAENISYAEDEDETTLDFDETELDQEWQDRIEDIGMEPDHPEDLGDSENNILSIEDDEGEDDITDVNQKIDEEKVFYVKVDNEGETFIGKIYKLFDEGDWRAKLIDGESETFEKLNYDPDYDEYDIIAFLRENYADAEIISEDEFNDQTENAEIESEVKESHNIITLEDFLKESS